MPNADGSPGPGDPGYLAPNTGLLAVGQGGSTPTAPVAGYDPSQATASTAKSTGYDPSKYVVTPDQTVEGRAAKIAGDDSVLMQQARVRANQDAQSKGLLSSSLAVQAGENAVLGAAVPIASQDAATTNAAMTNTVNAENAAKQFGAGAGNQAALTNAGLLTSTAQTNAQQANAAKETGTTAFNAAALQGVDVNTRTLLANLQVQNNQLLQTNSNAATMFNETVKNIAGIAVDPTLTQAAKDAATQSQINLLNEGLRTTAGVATTVPAQLGALNLDQYFQTGTGGTSAAFTPAQKATQAATLDQQISALQAQRQDVATNGTGVPVLSGPDASARRVPLWQAAISNLDRQIQALQAQRATLVAA